MLGVRRASVAPERECSSRRGSSNTIAAESWSSTAQVSSPPRASATRCCARCSTVCFSQASMARTVRHCRNPPFPLYGTERSR